MSELRVGSITWSQRSIPHDAPLQGKEGAESVVVSLAAITLLPPFPLPPSLPSSLPPSLPPSLSSFLIQDNVRVDEVKCHRKYLNSGDVFILDLGLDLYQVCVDEAGPAHFILLLSLFSGMVLRATRINAPKLWSSFKL